MIIEYSQTDLISAIIWAGELFIAIFVGLVISAI